MLCVRRRLVPMKACMHTQEVENFSDIAKGRHLVRQLTQWRERAKADSVVADAKI